MATISEKAIDNFDRIIITSTNAASSSQPHSLSDNEWGWGETLDDSEVAIEPHISFTDERDQSKSLKDQFHNQGNHIIPSSSSTSPKVTHSSSPRNQSNEHLHPTTAVLHRQQHSNNNIKKSMTSSPSFQELESAIGATIALNLGHSSSEDLENANKTQSPNSPGHGLFLDAIAQQKMQHQRQKQKQQYQQYANQQIQYSPSHNSTKADLNTFICEQESRAIILFHSPSISTSVVRDACQKFGVLYYIRPEFHFKGVTLLCYFDLRSAIKAKTSLTEILGDDAEVAAHYSMQLHTSSNSCDEFRLIVKKVPQDLPDAEVQSVFSRFGQIRSFEKAITSDGSSSGSDGCSGVDESQTDNQIETTATFFVEFFSMQDARLAASELSSSQMWGARASISFTPLEEHKQQLGRLLLGMLSKWRTEQTNMSVHSNQMPGQFMQMLNTAPIFPGAPHHGAGMYSHPAMINNSNVHPGDPSMVIQSNFIPSQMSGPMPVQVMYSYPTQASQIFHSNSYSNLQNMGGYYDSSKSTADSSRYPDQDKGPRMDYQPQSKPMSQEHSLSGSSSPRQPGSSKGNGQVYSAAINSYATASANLQSMHTYNGVPTDPRPHHHYGGHAGQTSNGFNGRGGNGRMQRGNGGVNSHATHSSSDGGDSEFILDAEKLLSGIETRTTLMVRNIPNKYHQQMLLDEVNVRHEGTYDFFYLPIDFKNKCNVGYCFINFLEVGYILPFVKDFNGQRWKSFNSEKVCVITFARIQGKTAMISRFQNSSLLEKDDEYQPLLFHSSGPDRGKQEHFPLNRANRQQPQQMTLAQARVSHNTSPSGTNGSDLYSSVSSTPSFLSNGTNYHHSADSYHN